MLRWLLDAELDNSDPDRLPAPVLALYISIYSVRYTSWAIGTEMEHEVLDLANRLISTD